MAEHSTVNRRVAGSSPAWGVFLLLGQELASSPFLMPVSRVRLLVKFCGNEFLLSATHPLCRLSERLRKVPPEV